jgi:hypothetical protein
MRKSYARPGVLTTPTAAMAEDCKTQRSRWAGGAAQIAKKHWRHFLPGTSLLDHDQKREFAFGWLNWVRGRNHCRRGGAAQSDLGAVRCFQDRCHPGSTAHPADLQCIPRVARPLCLFILIARRCSLLADAERNGGVHVRSVDGSECSLSSRAASEQNYFHRTRKGTGAIVRTLIMAMPEAVLGALLVAGSIIVYATNFYRVLEADLFATILLIQSLPSCRPWHWCGWSASAKVDREK